MSDRTSSSFPHDSCPTFLLYRHRLCWPLLCKAREDQETRSAEGLCQRLRLSNNESCALGPLYRHGNTLSLYQPTWYSSRSLQRQWDKLHGCQTRDPRVAVAHGVQLYQISHLPLRNSGKYPVASHFSQSSTLWWALLLDLWRPFFERLWHLTNDDTTSSTIPQYLVYKVK